MGWRLGCPKSYRIVTLNVGTADWNVVAQPDLLIITYWGSFSLQIMIISAYNKQLHATLKHLL